MEKLIGLKELRQNMSDYAQKVKKGQSFVVLKQSKPIFKIVPVDGDDDTKGVWEEVVDFTKIKKGGVNVKELLSRL